MSEGTIVDTSGGLPTLRLNNGGQGLFNAPLSDPSQGKLVFDYTVQPGQDTGNLAISGVDLPSETTVQDTKNVSADFTAALDVGLD